MLVLAGVLGLILFLSTGALGSIFAGGNSGVGGVGGIGSRPTETLEPGEPTATPEQGVTVPDITGFTEVSAEQTLRQLLLVPVRQTSNHPQIEFSRVISQEIAPGTLLPPGQPVTYTVSLGPLLVTVPEVISFPAELAQSQLSALGLVVEIQQEPSQNVTAGFVIGQSLSPGLRVAQGQSITLRVSRGDVVRFPDVIGLQREEAVRVLSATSGMELVFVDEQGRDRLIDYDRFAVGEVVSAQVEGGDGLQNGQFIPRGSRIILGVKRGE
jgi:serine/threonine-protein kinase